MRLPHSMLAKVGAVVATATIAAAGATTAANAATAAPAVHKIPTALAISNTTPKGHPHQTTAVINGHLTAGSYNLRHLRVLLERLGAKGVWHVVQVKLTRVHGHVFYLVHVRQEAATFRLVFPGTRNFAASLSDTDTISPVTSPAPYPTPTP